MNINYTCALVVGRLGLQIVSFWATHIFAVNSYVRAVFDCVVCYYQRRPIGGHSSVQ